MYVAENFLGPVWIASILNIVLAGHLGSEVASDVYLASLHGDP